MEGLDTEKDSVRKQEWKPDNRKCKFNGKLGWTQYARERHRERESKHKPLLKNNTQSVYIVCVQWTLLYKSFMDWQYLNAHLWAPTLTPKYIPYGISFQRPPGFCTEPAFLRTGLCTGSRTRPHRYSPRLLQPIRPMLSLSLNKTL